MSRLLLKDDGPPALRRKIVDLEGEELWTNEIAPAVQREADGEIARAIFALQGLAEEIRVRDYEELREQVRTGAHAERLQGAGEEVRVAISLMSRLSDDYSAALSTHPEVKALWEAQRKTQPPNKGILEVLEMFLFCYTNAEVFGRFADEGKLTPAVWDIVDLMLYARLGALIAGGQEKLEIAQRKIKVAAWLREGLGVAETKLDDLKADAGERQAYVTFNLDNVAKAYFRKLKTAKDPPGGQLRGTKDPDWYFRNRLPTLSSKEQVTAALRSHMRERGLDTDDALKLLENVPILDELKPSREELEKYIAERAQKVQPDVVAPFHAILGYHRVVDGTAIKVTAKDALAWRSSPEGVGDVVLRKDDVDYRLLKVRDMVFDLKRISS